VQFLNLFIDISTLFLTIHVYGVTTVRFLFRRIMGNYLQTFIYFPDLRNVCTWNITIVPFVLVVWPLAAFVLFASIYIQAKLVTSLSMFKKCMHWTLPFCLLFLVVCPLAAFVLFASIFILAKLVTLLSRYGKCIHSTLPMCHLFFVVCPLAAFVLMISNISIIINQIMKLKRLQNFIDTILLINTWKYSEVKIVSNNDKT
jgi:hypothetical protein